MENFETMFYFSISLNQEKEKLFLAKICPLIYPLINDREAKKPTINLKWDTRIQKIEGNSEPGTIDSYLSACQKKPHFPGGREWGNGFFWVLRLVGGRT